MHMRSDGIATIAPGELNAPGNFFWTGSLEDTGPGYQLREHSHRLPCYMLLCTQGGEGSVVIDKEEIRIQQPGIVCIKPGSICSLHLRNAAVICFTEDFFSLRYNSNVLSGFSFLESGSYIPLDEQRFHNWQLLAGLMLQEFLHHDKAMGRVLRSYLNILLCTLDRYCNTAGHPNRTNSREEKIRRFESLLEEHYKAHKTPSFYAAQLHITTNYLNKLCRQCKSVSSGELIRKRVIIEAQRLLYHTALSVAEIADDLGFETASYFATFFKRNTSMTPERFRKHDNK